MSPVSNIPQPQAEWRVWPWMNNSWALVFTAAVLVTAFYMVRIWRREKEPVGLILIVGAALASVLEPMLDILGMAFHPRNQPILFETYGYPMPLWVLPLYTFYMSAFTMLVWRALERGAGPRTLWKFFLGLCFFDLVMETVGLSVDVWVYYGYQPLRIFQFPLWWAPCNAGGPVLAGILLYALRRKLPGWRSVALVCLGPICFMVSYAIVAWPTWAVLNTRLPAVVTWWGGVATLILGVAMCWFYCHLFELVRHARTHPGSSQDTPVDGAADVVAAPPHLAAITSTATR